MFVEELLWKREVGIQENKHGLSRTGFTIFNWSFLQGKGMYT